MLPARRDCLGGRRLGALGILVRILGPSKQDAVDVQPQDSEDSGFPELHGVSYAVTGLFKQAAAFLCCDMTRRCKAKAITWKTDWWHELTENYFSANSTA